MLIMNRLAEISASPLCQEGRYRLEKLADQVPEMLAELLKSQRNKPVIAVEFDFGIEHQKLVLIMGWERVKFVMYDWARKDMPNAMVVVDPVHFHI